MHLYEFYDEFSLLIIIIQLEIIVLIIVL